MNIEERVKNEPEKFEKILNGKKEDLEFAVKDLSQKLDIVIWGAVSEYAKQENVEANVEDIKKYPTLAKLIEHKVDKVIGEYLVKVGKVKA